MRREVRATATVISPHLTEPLRTEVVRKLIHMLVALVPFIASVDLHLAVGLLAGGTLFYLFAEDARRRGRRVLLVSDLTLIASRSRDHGRFVVGPVTLGLGAMLALLLYPEPGSMIAVFALAFGDSAASLIGKSVGGPRIPLTRGKTVAGSFACFAVVAAVTYRISADAGVSAVIGLAAAFFEALPFSDMDNVILPVGTGFVAARLLAV